MFAIGQYQQLRRRVSRAATCVLLRESDDKRSQSIDGMSRTEIRRVLVCRPNHRLGNLLLLTPLLRELQHVLPAAEVDIVLAGADGAGLFRTFRNVGQVYTLSRRMVRHPVQTVRIAVQIRRAQYDLVIDPCEGSQSSRWLTAIANAACVIGIPGDAPTVNADLVPRHMAKRPVYLLRQAVATCGASPDADYPVLDIQLSPAEHQRGQQILRMLTSASTSLPRVIGIFADATGTKRYNEAWWMGFIETLRARDPDCMVVEIAPPDGHSRLSSRFPCFFSPDIREVAAVISRMACFISADCGVMHLASASGTPTVGLFSRVTDISQYAPYGHGSCGIDTHGKTPEQVAQMASTVVRATQADSIAAVADRATSPTPVAKTPGVAGDTQPIRPRSED